MNGSCNCKSAEIQGLYVHVPFCDGKCGYCAFYSVLYDATLADRFLEALSRELASMAPLAPQTIYIGGGTPTTLSTGQLERLCGMLRDSARLERLEEWTVEANPGSITREKLSALRSAGVTRIGLGVQSFDDGVLQTLGRRHTAAAAFKALEMIRGAGGWSLGIDLIACVPGFSFKVWRRTLNETAAARPEHVSVYALTNEEGLAQRKKNGAAAGFSLLSDDRQLRELRLAELRLAECGYFRYEISNYALPGFECRHNIACWRGMDYFGAGPAACSRLGLKRLRNEPDAAAYIDALLSNRPPPREEEIVSEATQRKENLIFGLRMAEGVPEAAAAASGGALTELETAGLIERASGRLRLTRRGMELADYAAVRLLEDLNG